MCHSFLHVTSQSSQSWQYFSLKILSKLQPRCCFIKNLLSEFGLCFTDSASKLWQTSVSEAQPNFNFRIPTKLQFKNWSVIFSTIVWTEYSKYSAGIGLLFLWAIATKQSVGQLKIILKLRMAIICTNSNFKGVGNFSKLFVGRVMKSLPPAAGWAFSSFQRATWHTFLRLKSLLHSPEASFLYYHCAGASSLT